jgi:hypothetical protein
MNTRKLAENLIQVYSLILEEVGQVSFQNEDILYRIFQRSDESWEIGVYREELIATKVGEVFAFVEIDSSTCSGSSTDAVKFFL